MHRHVFSQLNARVDHSVVHLAFYLTTPVFKSREELAPKDTIRIHRLCDSEFKWGQDYEEYFDGLNVNETQLIYEGPLEAINHRKFEYRDENVEIGQTYVYWVSSPLGLQPTGPVAVRIRDNRVWWPHHEIESRLEGIAKAHPELTSIEEYGTTVGGRSVTGLMIGNREQSIALVGAIHPGESGPELIIPAVERLLKEHPQLLDEVGVAILPSVNSDERERLVQGCPIYLRKNSRGVDVNRNFDANWEQVEHGYGLVSSDPDAATYRGPTQESEPETQAVVKFITSVSPLAVFSFHALASITNSCCLTVAEGENDRAFVDRCNRFVKPFAAAFCEETHSEAGLRFGASAGSLPAYVYHKLGVPCFDLEWDGNPDSVPSHTDHTTLPMLETYQKRHYRGLLAALQAGAAE